MSGRVGVLLLNLGGPEKLDDVYLFLYNLFADPEIIRLPIPFLQKPIASLIAASRAPISQENYRLIGGGSPLRQITEEQGENIENVLQRNGIEAKVYVGMRYWHPYTTEAIAKIKEDGITRLVVLPLYPQYSISTSGSSLKQLDDLWENDPALQAIERITIQSWYDRTGYIRAMNELIDAKLQKFGDPEDVHIFFSAHGVPVRYVTEYNDPYQSEMENCVDGIMKALRRDYHRYNAHTLAYQSRVGPVEWLQPYTEEAIHNLAKRGIKNLLVVPISFVSEHIETLQEIDIEYREVAEESGIHNFDRVPALNSHPVFINDLAELIMESLGTTKMAAVPA
ncbi:MAG: ferrochelatase [Pseudanabaena sp.]|jgi:ferrochelatase|uniref:ferrochelatase n=1 Tax=Pseudanabaena mucicola TaxID=71190 RepID=UPI002578B695|nr:ferrochelatase [Pseudanabaena mucicola]MCA6574642.1 ferrochelatase [Pseudanabaena sp. M53BS1SP1A06MG]MCA6584119.1 ferrochelatase [Pseudanabaena sp. M34BS1SP1A06MG]MCA6585892.1 ferrochelatase [Pseudanabaena sp. M051S1SP1A06QC]MCA6593910.1 ferrochelatase [Pseudanabaena sp. M38BS1SP1A06MG]MCA6597104.1 ferrochelatase [Pseudanabaena sp. M046S1SP1A06QC]MCA6600963.1 ferrochelatase [Pseudanabaena sp. M57BS1SP1A06MG]MCA6613015.1 ferrochelatase [Pseudanabaena sp. M158S2SP1A06QC]MCA6614404.1 ferroc